MVHATILERNGRVFETAKTSVTVSVWFHAWLLKNKQWSPDGSEYIAGNGVCFYVKKRGFCW